MLIKHTECNKEWVLIIPCRCLDIVRTSVEQGNLHEIHHKAIVFPYSSFEIELDNLQQLVDNLGHHLFQNDLSKNQRLLDQILKIMAIPVMDFQVRAYKIQ